jgi:hypothetical protein
MSAQDHLGRQFTIHRGLDATLPSEPLGIHWSKSLRSAEMFADPETHEDGRKIVLHAKVNPQAVVKPQSAEGKRLAKIHLIGDGFESTEKETTIRPGATVAVTSRTSHRVTKSGEMRQREVRYKKPRKMQA